MQFAAFGIGSALTKFIAEFIDDRTTIHKYVSSGIISSIITGTLMGAVLFFLAPLIATSVFHTPELENMIWLTALCYPFISIQKAVLGTLNGLRRMRAYAFLNIVQNVAVFMISIILVSIFDMGAMGAVIGLVVPTILISILCPALIHDLVRPNGPLWNNMATRETIMFGFYIVLGNSINFLNAQVGTILVGHYTNTIEVGIYAVAVLFAQVLTLIPTAVQQVVAPMTATLYGRGDLDGIRRLFYSTLKKSFVISTGSAMLIAIAGPYIITIFFSEEYLSAYIPLLILLVGHIFGSSFGAVSGTLACIGKVQIPFRIGAICAILNVAMSTLLIPIFGTIGAALAITATMIVHYVITINVIRKYIGTQTPRHSKLAR